MSPPSLFFTKLVWPLRAWIFVLFMASGTLAHAEFTPEQVKRFKATTAALMAGDKVIRPAFCISETGIFATCNPRMDWKKLRLVLDFGGPTEKSYPVATFRTDGTLALLKVDLDRQLQPFTLGDDASLALSQNISVIGYTKLGSSEIGMAAFTILNTSIKRVGTKAHWERGLFWLDRNMPAGLSGSPVLDGAGKVIGVVSDGVDESGIRAVGVSELKAFPNRPEVAVSAPNPTFEKRFEPANFVVTVDWLKPPAAEPTVSLEIANGTATRRVNASKKEDQKYHALLPPLDRKTAGDEEDPAPVTYRVTVQPAEGDAIVIKGALPLAVTPPAARPLEPLTGKVNLTEKREFALPSICDDLVVAGNGRLLVFHLRGGKQLAVFDVIDLKMRGMIQLAAEPALFAGGSRYLLVAYPGENLIERYSLETLKKEKTVRNPFRPLIQLTMGYSSPNLALFSASSERVGGLGMRLGEGGVQLFDAESMRGVASLEDRDIYRLVGERRSRTLASADGLIYCFFDSEFSVSNSFLAFRDNQLKLAWRDSLKNAKPNADGSLFYTSQGPITSNNQPLFVAKANEPFPYAFLPSHGSRYFLGVPNHDLFPQREKPARPLTVGVFTIDSSQPLCSLPEPLGEMNPPHNFNYEDAKAKMPIDKRYHYYPQFNLLLTIPYTDDKIVARPLNVQQLLRDHGANYLYVTSSPPAARVSQPFSYQLEAASQDEGAITFSLQSGPDGLTVSPGGNVSWSKPAAAGHQRVLVALKNAAGAEAFHTFFIAVAP